MQLLEYQYELKNEDTKRFKNILSTAFARKRALEKLESSTILPKIQKGTLKDRSQFQWKMSNASKGFITRPGVWSDTETENLLIVLEEGYRYSIILNEDGQTDWAKVSDYMPERSGKMCYDRYRYLKRKNNPKLEHLFDQKVEEKLESYKFNPDFMSAFTKEKEQGLISIINGLLNDGKAVTVNKISSIAKTMYYSPLSLSTKVLIISQGQLGNDVLNEKGEIKIDQYQDK